MQFNSLNQTVNNCYLELGAELTELDNLLSEYCNSSVANGKYC